MGRAWLSPRSAPRTPPPLAGIHSHPLQGPEMQSWWLLQNRKATVQTRAFSCQKCGVFAVCPRPADQTLALCPRPRPLPGTLWVKHAPRPLAPRPSLAPASAGLATLGSTRRCAVPKAPCGSGVQGGQTYGNFSRWGHSAGPRQAAQPQHPQPSHSPWASACPSGDEEPGAVGRPLRSGLASPHL